MRADRGGTLALAFVTVAALAGGRAATAAPARATAAPAARAVREDDLLRFEWVADPRISPDGSRIAFTRVSVDTVTDNYRTSLWIIDADGAAPAPRPLTAGPRDAQPRWSPDGKAIAFVRGAEGKPGQLYVLSMEGGEAVQLTRLAGGAGSPAWSPDGGTIAFTSSTRPALDADTAKAALETTAVPGDVGARAMLNSIGSSKTKRGSKSTESTLHALEKPIR